MRRFALIVLLSFLLLTLPSIYKANIPKVKASPDIRQGDLILTGNNVTVIEGQFDINGSIIVEDNATLVLRNAIVNFIQVRNYQFNMTFQNPVNGNPRLLAENTTLTSAYSLNVSFFGNSSCKGDKLEVWSPYAVGYWWWVYDSSVVSISNSRVYMVTAYADSILEVFNCTMRYMNNFSQISANISSSYIESLFCFGSSAVSVSNSTINVLYAYQSSIVQLVNSTYNFCFIHGEGKVYVWWYLDVQVIDSDSTGVPSANVTVRYPNATVVESRLTDTDGWTQLTLMEKMINATDNYPVGNYTVTAKYETNEGQQSVNMTGNKEITIQLTFIIPEFSLFIILSLFMIAIILAVIVYRRKHSYRLLVLPKSRFTKYNDCEISLKDAV